ncbi:MAG TPA: hypothetical protein VEZ12_19505 [Herpetosiphonaceae bacterium]|jgi:protein-disulfide isomerase|nr:hypothetical protein [Herpetosiphonaceae bacterium]
MSRLRRTALLAGLLVVLTACGAAGTPGWGSVATTRVPATTEIVDVPAAAMTTAVSTPETEPAPVTAMMDSLRLAGERFATAGDPNAPITVVEFSDFG